MRKLPEVLAIKCTLKSTEIFSRKRVINEFAICSFNVLKRITR